MASRREESDSEEESSLFDNEKNKKKRGRIAQCILSSERSREAIHRLE